MYVSIIKPNMEQALGQVRDEELRQTIKKIRGWCSSYWIIRTESVATGEMHIATLWDDEVFSQMFRIVNFENDIYTLKYVGSPNRVIIDMYEDEPRKPMFYIEADPRLEFISHEKVTEDHSGPVTVKIYKGQPIPLSSLPGAPADGYVTVSSYGEDIVHMDMVPHPDTKWYD